MTQASSTAEVLRRLREQALNAGSPLVTPEDEERLERLRGYALKLLLALLNALIEGRITTQEWERATGLELQRAHTLAYALGRGSPDFLDALDRARIARRTSEQNGYLTEFAASLVTIGITAFTMAYLQNRIGLYLNALLASLNEGRIRALGLPPLPAYPGDGSTRCLMNCKCHWRIVALGDNDFDAYWTLGYVETDHCETCPRRALAWSPLTIRNGVLQPYPTMGLFHS